MTSARASAIAAINNYKSNGQAWNFRETPTNEIFGTNVFGDSVMKDRLPKSVYKALQATIKQGKPLDPTIADAVASGSGCSLTVSSVMTPSVPSEPIIRCVRS